MQLYLLILLGLFFNPEEAFCSCRQSVEISMEEIEKYDLIFRGVVRNIEEVDDNNLITFEIQQVYSGQLHDRTVTISSRISSSMCGLNIVVGGEWLLFAYERDSEYLTNSCTRSGMINSSMNHVRERVRLDMQYLNKLQ